MCKSINNHTDTFRAYDSDGDNKISKREFIQVIEESWKAAFRFLAEKDIKGLTIRDVENWATRKVQVLNEHSTKLFNKMDTHNKGVLLHYSFSILSFRPSGSLY